jgi:hypothetical protein
MVGWFIIECKTGNYIILFYRIQKPLLVLPAAAFCLYESGFKDWQDDVY